MSKQTRQHIEPDNIDIGISPDVPGVVSIFHLAAGGPIVMALPPEAALLYAAQIQSRATQLLSGNVRVSSHEPSTDSVSIERSRSDRLDS